MNQTSVENTVIVAEKLLEKGDREAIRQMVTRLGELLHRGPTEEQGGPVGTDPDVLKTALKLQMRKCRANHKLGMLVVSHLCASQRQRFVEEVNGLCAGTLTLEEQEYVASRFNVPLCYWLRTAAELVQRETKDYHDLEVVRSD